MTSTQKRILGILIVLSILVNAAAIYLFNKLNTNDEPQTRESPSIIYDRHIRKTMDSRNNCIEEVYLNAEGEPTSIIRMEYDQSNNCIERRSFDSNNQLVQLTVSTYDPQNRLVQSIVYDGHDKMKEFIYCEYNNDGTGKWFKKGLNGNMIQYSIFNTDDLEIEAGLMDISGELLAKEVMEYTIDKKVDKRKRYDGSNRLISQTQISYKESDNEQRHFTIYADKTSSFFIYKDGRPAEHVLMDPQGNWILREEYRYDSLGKRTSKKTYDRLDRLREEWIYDSDGINYQEVEYDESGNVMQKQSIKDQN